MHFKCAVTENIHTHPQGRSLEILRRRGVLKSKRLEGRYENRLEFPGGGGGGGGEGAKQKTFRGRSM